MRSVIFIIITLCILTNVYSQEKYTFKDTDGKHINAHGGGILFHKGTYYWYGEIKEGESYSMPSGSRRVDAGGVSCYSSKDLKN
ncbi:MAG TPA: hypothetical protein VK023_09185 [Sphingobacterium bovisgrunnientis]|jgi:hypothetical protein|nr:hypothetical protein [Sphingobacterium bovisgrunnientis]